MIKKQDILDTLQNELKLAEERRKGIINPLNISYYDGQVDLLKKLIGLFEKGCEE